MGEKGKKKERKRTSYLLIKDSANSRQTKKHMWPDLFNLNRVLSAIKNLMHMKGGIRYSATMYSYLCDVLESNPSTRVAG